MVCQQLLTLATLLNMDKLCVSIQKCATHKGGRTFVLITIRLPNFSSRSPSLSPKGLHLMLIRTGLFHTR